MVKRIALYVTCLFAGFLPACATAEAFGPAALTRERAAIERGPGSDLIFVDPDWLKSCLGSTEVITEPTNRDALETLLPQYNLVAFSDIRGPDAHCGP